MYLEGLTEEEKENVVSISRHPGIKHVLGLIDEIVDRMRNDVLTIPLPPDPQAAAIAVYAKRCSAEGAGVLRNTLKLKMNELRYAKEGELK